MIPPAIDGIGHRFYELLAISRGVYGSRNETSAPLASLNPASSVSGGLNMAVAFKYDVFLSHSAKDKAVVRPLSERLRQGGLKVWLVPPKRPGVGGFDEWVLKPRDSIPAETWKGWSARACWPVPS
jgi:hypothetical protein